MGIDADKSKIASLVDGIERQGYARGLREAASQMMMVDGIEGITFVEMKRRYVLLVSELRAEAGRAEGNDTP